MRLIDEILDVFKDINYAYNDCSKFDTLKCMLTDALEASEHRIAELEAKLSKHGEWIKLDMHAHLADHKCTACGQECYVPTCMGEPMYTYCPNCGAKMKGEVKNDGE